MKLVLLGGGEHARVVAEAAALAGLQVLDLLEREREGLLAGLLAAHPGAGVHIACGGNALRLAIAHRLGDLPWMTVAHPRAIISPSAHLAAGACIAAGAVVQAGAAVGAHAIVNSGAIVEHDCRLGAACHLAPGAVLGGGVAVGERAFIGLGARVRDHLRIGAGAIVGMGAVVVADVPDGATVIGVPARIRETA